jgi:hypothetical protein
MNIKKDAQSPIKGQDGGWAGKPANGAFFLIFMGICALVG